MNRQYRDELDKVRLSAQSKQQLIDRLHEQSAPQTAKKCGRKRRAVVLAVAACVVLAATAGAAVLHDTLQHLWTYESQPVYEAYKTGLGRTQTADGWTVTLTDCVGSESSLYIGVELTVPEGVDPNGLYQFGDCDMTLSDGTKTCCGWGINQISHDVPDGNTLHYAWEMDIASEMKEIGLCGQTVNLMIDSINHLVWNAETDRYDEVLMTDHVWKFEDVKLDYPTADTTYAVDKPVEYLGGMATLDEITVSPFGVKVSISGGSAFRHHQEHRAKDGNCLACALTVYDADGNVLYENPLGGGNGSSCDEDTGRVTIYHDYKNEDWHKILIDPAKVAKVKVNNVEIPLK